MRLDPQTKLGNLLNAIPSAETALTTFEIPVRGNEDKCLDELCVEYGTTFDNFLKRLNELNWNEEYSRRQI